MVRLRSRSSEGKAYKFVHRLEINALISCPYTSRWAPQDYSQCNLTFPCMRLLFILMIYQDTSVTVVLVCVPPMAGPDVSDER